MHNILTRLSRVVIFSCFLLCFLTFTVTMAAAAVDYPEITVTSAGGAYMGSLINFTLTSNVSLSAGDEFDLLYNQNWYLVFTPNDLVSSPSRGGAICYGSDKTTQYGISSAYGSQLGLFIKIVQTLPANTPITCTHRVFPILYFPTNLEISSIQKSSTAVYDKSYSLKSSLPISVPVILQLDTDSVVYNNRQNDTLAMNYLDLSTIDFTISNLIPNVAIGVAIYPWKNGFTGLTELISDLDPLLAVYNEISPYCTNTATGKRSTEVRMYIDPISYKTYLVTGSNPDTTVTCSYPFSYNRFNMLALTYTNASAFVNTEFGFILYNQISTVTPTTSNAFVITNPQFQEYNPYLDTSITLYDSSYILTNIITTAKSNTTSIIVSTNDFIEANTGYSLQKFLSAATTRYQLVSNLQQYSQTSSSDTCTWTSVDSSDTQFRCDIPNTVPGQLFSLFINFPLSSLSSPLTHSFSIEANVTGLNDISTNTVFLQDTITNLFYSPAIIINPDSKVNQTTFTTSEYTFDYQFYAEWPSSSSATNSSLLQFFDTSTLFDFEFNMYMEPNLETRNITANNLNPECVLTWNTTETSMTASVQRYNRALPSLDISSRVYYHINGTNMRIGDIIQLSCTYDIIVTDTNTFPAPVDLVNQITVRNKESTFSVVQGYPVQLLWEKWWFVLQYGPRVMMANETYSSLCFVVAGPNTINDQTTLNSWLTDVLDILQSADVTSGTNWFKTYLTGIENFKWGWALSQYYSEAIYEDKWSVMGLEINTWETPSVISYSSNSSVLTFCIDPKLTSFSGDNTLFEQAFHANSKYDLHAVLTGSDATAIGAYQDQSMIYLANDKTFVPVLNLAMGTPCETTPACQAQGMDYCYEGYCTTWVSMPFDYLLYARQWKLLTWSNIPVIGKLPGEYFNFDIIAWTNSSSSSSSSDSEPDTDNNNNSGNSSGGNDDNNGGSGDNGDSGNSAVNVATIAFTINVIIIGVITFIMF